MSREDILVAPEALTGAPLDRTLSEDLGVRVQTRTGIELALRPVRVDDGLAVAALFDNLGPEGLLFRFLSGMTHMNADRVAELIEVDHRHVEHLLAFAADRTAPVASLMIAADAAMDNAEVAIAVAQDWRGKGIGYALLHHAVELARERGIRVLRAVESRASHDAIEVERTLGFVGRPYPEDPTLIVLEARLG